MSASALAKEKMMEQNSNASGFSDALWLAKKDVRRSWMSYPASGAAILAVTFFISPTINGSLEMEGFGMSGAEGIINAFFADYMFVIITAVLAVNALSMDYMRVWTSDVFSDRLAFLRSLPASTTSLVGSRVMSMLFAVPFTVPAFFIPVYLLSDLGEIGSSYVWFVGIWLGWSLLYSGITLLCELAMNGRVYVWFSVGFVLGLVALIVVLEGTVEINLVARSANLAVQHGPISAAVSLLVGASAFGLFARETRNRIEKREIS